MHPPKVSFEAKITLGNILSIVVFIAAGAAAVTRTNMRIETIETRQQKIELAVEAATLVTRKEYDHGMSVAATDRADVRREMREATAELKIDLKALGKQQQEHFLALVSRMDRILLEAKK